MLVIRRNKMEIEKSDSAVFQFTESVHGMVVSVPQRADCIHAIHKFGTMLGFNSAIAQSADPLAFDTALKWARELDCQDGVFTVLFDGIAVQFQPIFEVAPACPFIAILASVALSEEELRKRLAATTPGEEHSATTYSNALAIQRGAWPYVPNARAN
jgi:hypothetical protein